MTKFEIDTLHKLLHMYEQELEQNGATVYGQKVNKEYTDKIVNYTKELGTFISVTK